MYFMVLLRFYLITYTNVIYSQYPIVGGKGWLRFLDLWSGQKPCWHERLTMWCRWSACDVSEARLEELENEQWWRWSDGRVDKWGSAHSATLLTSLYLRQRHFTNVTWRDTHSCCNWYLTPVVNFGEVCSAQLAKSTFLTSTFVPWNLFRSFKVCSDAKERVRCRNQRDLFIPSKTATLVLNMQWNTCLWIELQP